MLFIIIFINVTMIIMITDGYTCNKLTDCTKPSKSFFNVEP